MQAVLNTEGLISVRLGHGQGQPGDIETNTAPQSRTEDGKADCHSEAAEQPWLQVDLVLDVPRPSPAVAFAAIDEGCTGQCSPLECQMALHAAGEPSSPNTFARGATALAL